MQLRVCIIKKLLNTSAAHGFVGQEFVIHQYIDHPIGSKPVVTTLERQSSNL